VPKTFKVNRESHCMNHLGQRENQSSVVHAAVETKVMVYSCEATQGCGSGRQQQPEEHACRPQCGFLLDQCLLEKHRILSPVLQALVHVPKCLQKFDGVKVGPSQRFRGWDRTQSGCRPCFLFIGWHHSQNKLSGATADASRCGQWLTNGVLRWEDQENRQKGR